MKALVVGAGCCGASAARRLAELGWEVTVVERRSHIGGNAYDRRDRSGLLYHVYGPHLFFTDREPVWQFVEPFAEWTPFRCSIRVWIEGDSHPMPFQPETLRRLMPGQGDAILQAMERQWPDRENVTVLELLEADELLLRLAGQRLYDCDCAPYNRKQWELRPEELSSEVIARAPVWLKDRKEFRPERFQFLPVQGFTEMFRTMLRHPSIRVLTGLDALSLFRIADGVIEWTGDQRWDAVLYTGSLDHLFEGQEGRLPYRTLRFQIQEAEAREGLPCLSMYYPEASFPWTRRTDYRHLPGNPPESEKTLLIGECPAAMAYPKDEPYYVVLTSRSKEQYCRYHRLAEKTAHLYIAGRLAEFRYYNMDDAVYRGIETAEALHQKERGGLL